MKAFLNKSLHDYIINDNLVNEMAGQIKIYTKYKEEIVFYL